MEENGWRNRKEQMEKQERIGGEIGMKILLVTGLKISEEWKGNGCSKKKRLMGKQEEIDVVIGVKIGNEIGKDRCRKKNRCDERNENRCSNKNTYKITMCYLEVL